MKSAQFYQLLFSSVPGKWFFCHIFKYIENYNTYILSLNLRLFLKNVSSSISNKTMGLRDSSRKFIYQPILIEISLKAKLWLTSCIKGHKRSPFYLSSIYIFFYLIFVKGRVFSSSHIFWSFYNITPPPFLLQIRWV